jgi:HlyD family secretion protein
MKINILRLIILAVITATVFSCGFNNSKKIVASGTIEIVETNISSKNADEVENMAAEEGNYVKEGDVVAVINHAMLDLQLKEVESGALVSKYQLELILNGARTEDLQLAEETVSQAKANYESAEKDLNRNKDLFDRGNIPQKQFDDAQTKYLTTKTQFNSAMINLNKLKRGARGEEINSTRARYNQTVATMNVLKKRIEDCTIKSPVTGIVTHKFVEKGEFVNAGTPIYTVSKLDPVNLTIYVTEIELGKIKLGQKAKIIIDAYPKKDISGKIVYISPNAEFTPKNIQTKEERVKQVFGVKLEIPNPDGILKPGMPADAVIENK